MGGAYGARYLTVSLCSFTYVGFLQGTVEQPLHETLPAEAVLMMWAHTGSLHCIGCRQQEKNGGGGANANASGVVDGVADRTDDAMAGGQADWAVDVVADWALCGAADGAVDKEAEGAVGTAGNVTHSGSDDGAGGGVDDKAVCAAADGATAGAAAGTSDKMAAEGAPDVERL